MKKILVAISTCTVLATNSLAAAAVVTNPISDVLHQTLNTMWGTFNITSQGLNAALGNQRGKIADTINNGLGIENKWGKELGNTAEACIGQLLSKVDLPIDLNFGFEVCGNDIGAKVRDAIVDSAQEYIKKKLEAWAGNPGIEASGELGIGGNLGTINNKLFGPRSKTPDGSPNPKGSVEKKSEDHRKECDKDKRKCQENLASAIENESGDGGSPASANNASNRFRQTTINGKSGSAKALKQGSIVGKPLSQEQKALLVDQTDKNNKIDDETLKVFAADTARGAAVNNTASKYGNDQYTPDQLRGKPVVEDNVLNSMYVLHSDAKEVKNSELGDSFIYTQGVLKASDPKVNARNDDGSDSDSQLFNNHVEQARSLLKNSAKANMKPKTANEYQMIHTDQNNAALGLGFINVNQRQAMHDREMNYLRDVDGLKIAILRNILDELQQINAVLRAPK